MFGLYDDLDKKLQGRNAKSRKLANNTYAIRNEDGTIAVRLHATDILTISPDDSVVYQSGGWLTPTTKDRMTTYGPVMLSSVRGTWKAYRWDAIKSERVFICDYFDGMKVNDINEVTNLRSVDVENAEKVATKETQKAIRAFSKRCEDERPMPALGDCFVCAVARSYEPGHYPSCLASHLEEGYVHGTLIWNALKAKGYADPSFILAYVPNNISSAMRTYLSKALLPNRAPMR